MPMTEHPGLGKGDSPITGSVRQTFAGITHPVFRTLNAIASAEVGALFPSHHEPKGFRIAWACRLSTAFHKYGDIFTVGPASCRSAG